ncbi:hypothetical protein [Streptomyces sp. AA1529]|uniref:hypothetical protein n=1 Tax=Streptomyces sp. AA1529 TaxID=1203257 RepID=UPI003D734B4B
MAKNDIDHRAIEKHVKAINKAYERAFAKYPVTMPPILGKGFTTAYGITGVGIEQDPQMVRFLIWLGEKPIGYRGDQSEYSEETGVPPEEVSVLAEALERDGLIGIHRTLGEGQFCQISADGRVELRRLAQLRGEPAARHRYVTDAFLRWLYATAHDQQPADPAPFLETEASYFAGATLSDTEVRYALARLVHSGLVEEATTDPRTFAITIDGIDCVLSGATVSDYLNRTRPGDYYSITGTNVVAGSQGKVEQHNHNNTFDPAAMREFAEMVKQFAPTFGMEPAQQAELIHDAEVLCDEASSETPQPERVRAAFDAVMNGLTQIGAASAGLGATIQHGNQALNAVFGG